MRLAKPASRRLKFWRERPIALLSAHRPREEALPTDPVEMDYAEPAQPPEDVLPRAARDAAFPVRGRVHARVLRGVRDRLVHAPVHRPLARRDVSVRVRLSALQRAPSRLPSFPVRSPAANYHNHQDRFIEGHPRTRSIRSNRTEDSQE